MATDAEIRARGINFLSPQRYLQNPYQLPTEEVVEETGEGGGITNTNAFNNGNGNGFNVYNPNPDSLRSYRPNYDYRQFSEYGSNPSTADIKQMDMNQEYFNAPPPSKLEGLAGMIPGAGIARFLGNQIGPYLPTNRRSIMENQLSGQGIMVNNIGQIVQGDGAYDTAGNVMAGYNPSKMTSATFDKRISKIQDTLEKKYGSRTYTGDKTKLDERIKAIEEAKANFLDADDEADDIYNFEKKQKQIKRDKTAIGRYLNKRDRVALAKKQINSTGSSNSKRGTPGGSADRFTKDGGMTYDNSSGDFRNSDGSNVSQDFNNTSASLDNYDASALYAKGGRAGYFFGGRVNYKVGGRINFQGGGMSMGNEENQKQSAEMGNTTVSNNNDDGGNNNPPPVTSRGGGADNNPPAPTNVEKPFGYQDNVMKTVLRSRYDTDLEEDIDNPKFNMENMFGITSQVPENTKLVGLNKKQTSYLDTVGKKIRNVDLTQPNLYTYDNAASIKKGMENLNKKSTNMFGSFDPDKITYSADDTTKNTFATDKDVEKYMNDKYGLTIPTGGTKIGLAYGGRAMFKNGGLASIL